ALAYVAFTVTPKAASLGLTDFILTRRALALGLSLFALAVGGGLFIVPAFAAVQSWAAVDRRARVVAAVNVLNASYMTVGGALLAVAQMLDAPLWILFGIIGLLTFGVAVLVIKVWGKEGVRDFGRLIFQMAYDLEVKGLENVPKPGLPTIIAPNHVSMLEAGMLHGVLPGHASFAVNTQIAEVKWIKPFLKLINAYVLDPTKPLATRGLVNTVKSGETIVIFPEGRITITGNLMKVYEGTGMIAEKADAWVVPVRVEGAERAKIWSYLRPTQIKKAWFPKVTLTFLPPVKLKVDAELKGKARRQAAGLALQDIMADTAVATAKVDRTLFEAFGDAVKTRSTAKVAVADPLGTKLSMKKLMIGAQVLGAKLTPYAGVGEPIGVMLPNSVGVTVVIAALSSIGRVPAMINFSSGLVSIRATCKAADVKTILTSRAFIEKGRLDSLIEQLGYDVKVVYLDDIRPQITALDKVRGLLRGMKPQVTRKPDDPAVILFTSGSEGTPKGVVLSHRNLLTNIAQGMNRVDINGEDKVFNALPVFHSFGLTVGTLMPLVYGIPLYMYPTPLHYRIIPELIYDVEATVMFGTDTFLNGYARVAHPYDMRTVRIVLAGAEAVKDRTRALYMEKFGVRILEGYGITETSPGLAMNSPLANKSGTVGRFVPLVEYRLEDVPGIEPVQGELKVGRLFVKGPNVMLGYLRAEKPGVLEPVPDGWYDSGDIVGIDRQGFIKIMGRAKRFAKVGGEMVSLAAAEAVAAETWPNTMTVMVALPDARKGERLVLITTDTKAQRAQFQVVAKAKGAGDLMTPSEIIVVDKLPLLGSGKPDFVAALAMAKERTRVSAEPVVVE
ncbi:MAG: AMP-binding protein, partial [Hyphomicrobiaceae bacterium]